MIAHPLKLAFGVAVTLVLALPTEAPAQVQEPRFAFELEGGAVWQQRNDVQIPNDDSATRFSIVDLIGNGPYPAFRLYITWNITDRHGLRALAAPLAISGTGVPTEAIHFAGETYAAGRETEAYYRFSSWRLSYRYRFHHSARWTWRIGFTAKIRDAEVRLTQGQVSSKDTDLGFVPLLHVSGAWRFARRWAAELDLDALAGGPGRAEDISLKARYNVRSNLSLAAGYRMLEGGADVESVYNFAWLHYAVLSVVLTF